MGAYALLTSPSRYSSSTLLLISSPFLCLFLHVQRIKRTGPLLSLSPVAMRSFDILPGYSSSHVYHPLERDRCEVRWRQGKVLSAVSHYPRPAPAPAPAPLFFSFFTKLQRGGSSSLKRFTQLKFVKRRGRKKERRVRREKNKIAWGGRG